MNTGPVLAHGLPPRVLVVWCPDWPVVVACTDSADATAPAAVVAAGLVVACSAAARAAGVRRGQRLRDAQRHCLGLMVRARDIDAEARAFEPVVTAVAEFCPRVEVVRPGMCAIGVRGPARYFGGEKALAGKITQALTGRGVAGRIGVADGMFAAQLAARTGTDGVVVPPGGTRRFLAPHPVALFEDHGLADLLSRLGIHTLGDFAALPAGAVLARFGVVGATLHRLASGLDPRPLAPRSPSADLSEAIELDPPAAAVEPVVFAGRALAGRLHTNLAGRGLACARVEVQVVFAGGQVCSRLWRHDGLLSSPAVAERVRWQLGGWRGGGRRPDAPGTGEDRSGAHAAGEDRGAPAGAGLAIGPPADAANDAGAGGGGVTMLRLIPDQVVPDTGTQLGLWCEALIGDRVARAAASVQSLLGHEAVARPVRSGGRGPGEQVTLTPFGDSRTPKLPADRPWPGRIPAPSPITVYQAPLPARVTCASGEPVTVTGRAAISAPPRRLVVDGGPPREVTAWAGPWPVHERWWDPAHVRRLARFQLVTGDGAAWLAAVEGGRWVIEAGYD